MKAALSIELELLEPVLVMGADHLLQLHPSQIRWISVRLTADGEGAEAVTLDARADDDRIALQELVALARRVQPNGTEVLVWYQGRSERLTI